MNEEALKAVERWDSMELDELLRRIACESSLGAVPGDPEQQRQWGLAVVRAWFSGVRGHICGGPEGRRDNALDFLNDLALVIDVGTTLAGGIPVSQVAVAAFKYGIRGLCAEAS